MFLPQIDALGELMTLFVEHVGQNCMFYMSEYVERRVLHCAVFAFRDEAAQSLPQPLNSID